MVEKMKKILVALDGSKNSSRALNKGIEIAKNGFASITGISVIQVFPTEMGIVKTWSGTEIFKNSEKFLKIAKMMCAKNQVKFNSVIKYGDEGRTIVSFAHKNKYDLIVIGSRGRGRIKEVFLGSTSNYVLHSSKIPVLIVK